VCYTLKVAESDTEHATEVDSVLKYRLLLLQNIIIADLLPNWNSKTFRHTEASLLMAQLNKPQGINASTFVNIYHSD